MQTTVKRDGEKVWIEGVKGFSPAEYADSVHGSQARILQAVGESMTYDDLICYSGFAFRVGVHKTMCPSAGHPFCGFECIDNGYRALPWKTTIYEKKKREPEEQAAFEAKVCAAIKQSIDRGIPVHYGGFEDGLIIGYADEGRRWWCVHPYHKWGAEAFWYNEAKGLAGGKWPWGIVIWSEPKPAEERVPHLELARAALQQAVEMWRTEKTGDYYCGDVAYEHWLKWLRGVDAGEVEDPKGGMQGNGWYFDVLTHSRPIASRWLERAAEELDGEAKEQLLVAAGHYAEIAEVCLKDLKCSWSLALPPNQYEEWTKETRQKQIERGEAARQHDRAAIAAIEKALKAWP